MAAGRLRPRSVYPPDFIFPYRPRELIWSRRASERASKQASTTTDYALQMITMMIIRNNEGSGPVRRVAQSHRAARSLRPS